MIYVLYKTIIFNLIVFVCFSDWQNLLSLRNVVNNFTNFLMETYGHSEMKNDEIMKFRDYMCFVLCKLIEK